MRTTIVIDDSLGQKLKGVTAKKGLSRLINRCLAEHFDKEGRIRRLKELEKSYARASRGKKVSREFETIDREGWPEW